MTGKFDMTPDFGTHENSSIIKVLGVGGGGSNAVAHMYSEGIKGVDFMICNTDQGHLDQSPIPQKLLLGNGLGAGAKPEKARQYAMECKDKIAEFIGEETQMLFITAGMGKGTGTGASPVIAEVAHNMGILTIGVVTSPFEYEGKRRIRQAQEGIEELSKHVDSLIVIKNENILKYYQDEDILNSYGYANDVLKNACKCIAEMITCDYYQNVDFNDVKTVMTNSGRAMLGIATARGEGRIQKVVDEALACPLLDSSVIQNAENFLFFISFGPNAHFTGSELKEITTRLQELQSDDAEIIHGMGVDESLDDAVKLSVIITKFDTPASSLKNSNSIVEDSAENNVISTTDVLFGQQIDEHNNPMDIIAPVPNAPEELMSVEEPHEMVQETIVSEPVLEAQGQGPIKIEDYNETDDRDWFDKVNTPTILRQMKSSSDAHPTMVLQEEPIKSNPLFENSNGNDLNEFFMDLAD